MQRIGDFTLTWGESLRWDERRQRLYFVDVLAETLHWLEGAEPPLETFKLPSRPTGLVLTHDHRLVVCLADGLHVVDPDARTCELLAAYPQELGARANDANADHAGNLVTGTLNLTPGPGSLWHFSAGGGWTKLYAPFGNANGPVVLGAGGSETLVFGDTLARKMYGFPYDPAAPGVATPALMLDHGELGGAPDGATADADGAVWTTIVRGGKLARVTAAGLDRVVDVAAVNPSDVTFGGADLDRLFVTSIAVDLGAGTGDLAGALVSFDVGVKGRPEARFRLGDQG
jgi:sugar lactone lactonase YvrE